MIALVALLLTAPAPAPAATGPTARQLVQDLAVIEKSQAAVEALVAKGEPAVPELIGAAVEGTDLTTRGWAIVALGRIGGADADKTLLKLSNDGKQPPLVRTWATAGRISRADLDGVVALAPMVAQMPSLARPLSKRLEVLLASGDVKADKLLILAANNYTLQQQLVEPILALGAPALLDAMAHSKDQNARATAAGYVGTIAQRQGKAANETIGLEVIKLYKFDPAAKTVPWEGGPLYVPNIGWDKQMAKALVEGFISWYLWCELHEQKPEQSKISHNLNSLGLATPLGYQPEWQDQGVARWLQIWKQVAGVDAVRKLLTQQGAEKDSRFQAVLK
jgi:hypothetical protein